MTYSYERSLRCVKVLRDEGERDKVRIEISFSEWWSIYVEGGLQKKAHPPRRGRNTANTKRASMLNPTTNEIYHVKLVHFPSPHSLVSPCHQQPLIIFHSELPFSKQSNHSLSSSPIPSTTTSPNSFFRIRHRVTSLTHRLSLYLSRSHEATRLYNANCSLLIFSSLFSLSTLVPYVAQPNSQRRTTPG